MLHGRPPWNTGRPIKSGDDTEYGSMIFAGTANQAFTLGLAPTRPNHATIFALAGSSGWPT